MNRFRGSAKFSQLVTTIAFVFSIIVSACSVNGEPGGPPTAEETQAVVETVVVQMESVGVTSLEDMVTYSQLIFVGQITDISPTTWNQDSGEFWNDEETGEVFALHVHTVELGIVQSIVNELSASDSVQITTIGGSPIDGVILEVGENQYQIGDDPGAYQVGDQVLVFARQTDIAWRGGTKSVLYFVPEVDMFTIDEDGVYNGNYLEEPVALQELIDQILAFRSGQ